MDNAQKQNRPSEVIYQIYPASFYDSNGDGHGDLNGIIQKLDYIKSLGVDAVWISPFFLSPEGKDGDGGYAVADYRKIDPKFGTMDDFERLLDEAHKRHLRIYTDFVLCHTANNHEWFEKSRNREPGYENRYVWHDGRKENGLSLPPNNWLSVFKGETGGSSSAWKFDQKRGQYYLHHFNSSQPALNLNDKNVQNAVLKEMKFWLDKGVDGLRLDALPFANHDPGFNNNPWIDKGNYNRFRPWDPHREYWNEQYFQHSMCQPETVELVKKIRRLMDSYHPPKTSLGEVVAGRMGGDDSMEMAHEYLDPQSGLHTCYTQSLVQFYNQYPAADRLRNMIKKNVELSPDGGFCNNLGNHDFPRFATRMMGDAPYDLHDRIVRQLMQLAVALPGSLCLYNGEELGLTQATPEDLNGKRRDLVAIENRDPCRTPFPWEAGSLNAGFSTSSDPYLPVPRSHLPLAVDVQEGQTESMLNFTRRIVQQRKENSALSRGKTIVLDMTDSPIVAFVRQTENQTVLCSFNMSGRNAAFRPADYLDADTMSRLHIPGDGVVHLHAYSSSFHGLHLHKGAQEIGMEPAAELESNGPARTNGAKRIFAADMLIADNHLPEKDVLHSLKALRAKEKDLPEGEKLSIDKATYQSFMNELHDRTHKTPLVTPGGATSSTLWMLQKMLPQEVKIDFLGLAANDPHGKVIKKFLKNAGIHTLTEEWPEGIAQETSASHIIHHASGQHTILTYPGTEVEALHRVLAQEKNAELLEKSIKQSDLVYLPESTMGKFGIPFTNKILELRWQHKKELVLSLPTRANFGPDDRERFKFLIPSCNVVMGNDVEFCRILDKETSRPVSDEQMNSVVNAIQTEFRKNLLKQHGMPCSPHGQVAFITRGDKPALLVTKDEVKEIPRIRVGHGNNHLGASYAAFAGFLTGYLKGLSHEQSALLGMGLAAEKMQQESPGPFLDDPERSLWKTLLHAGEMRKIARAFETDPVQSPRRWRD